MLYFAQVKNMRPKVIITVIFILILFPSISGAYSPHLFPGPGIMGSTGLLRMPSADVLPYKNFNIGVDYGVDSDTNDPILFYKMNLGTFQGLEMGIVGGTKENVDSGGGSESNVKEGVFINLKYSLSTDNSGTPLLLAIGVENLSSYNDTDIYMVATRYLKEGPKIHFGFMGLFPGDKFTPLGMLGFDFQLGQGGILLLTEMFAGESIFQVDIGARMYFSPTLTANISGLNLFQNEEDPTGITSKAITAGFSWINPF